MTREQFLKVDGYSPLLWDSGLEDDNMQKRLKQKRMWPPDQPQVGGRQSQEAGNVHNTLQHFAGKAHIHLQCPFLA